MKPLIIDLPYPDVEKFARDVNAAKIISFAYATLHGELTAVLQYIYHSFHFGRIDKEFADTLESIAIGEMRHLDLLGNAMLSLGVDPIYRQLPKEPDVFFNTSAIAYSKAPEKMLLDDIQGEMNAISDYKRMLTLLKNEQAEVLIQRIIMDEELHLSTLKELFCQWQDKKQ